MLVDEAQAIRKTEDSSGILLDQAPRRRRLFTEEGSSSGMLEVDDLGNIPSVPASPALRAIRTQGTSFSDMGDEDASMLSVTPSPGRIGMETDQFCKSHRIVDYSDSPEVILPRIALEQRGPRPLFLSPSLLRPRTWERRNHPLAPHSRGAVQTNPQPRGGSNAGESCISNCPLTMTATPHIHSRSWRSNFADYGSSSSHS